jgi:hypothetical protein
MSETRRAEAGLGRERPIRNPRRRALHGAALTVSALLGLSISAQAAGPRARAAHRVNAKEEARLHFMRASGSTLIDEGHATGTIPGYVKISFTYTGSPNVSAQFTIYGSSGSLRVKASGKLSNPSSPSPSFKGSLSITGGSGRYAHAHGSGTLYGVFYRRSYGIVVQVLGTVYY